MIDELKPMNLGQLLDKTFRMTLSGFKNYLKIILVCLGVFLLISLVSLIVYGLIALFSLQATGQSGLDFQALSNHFFLDSTWESPAAVIYTIVLYLFMLLVFLVSFGLFSDLMIKTFLTQAWTLKQSFQLVRKKLATMINAFLLIFLMVIGLVIVDAVLLTVLKSAFLFAICYILTLVSLIFFIFVVPVILYEEQKALAAVKRSFRLVTYSFFQILGTTLLFFALLAVIALILMIPLAIFMGLSFVIFYQSLDEREGFITIIMILFVIFYFLFYFFVVIAQMSFTTSLFFNQKIKFENFGVELLARQMTGEQCNQQSTALEAGQEQEQEPPDNPLA